MKKLFSVLANYLFYIVLCTILLVSMYIKTYFHDISFDQLLYSLSNAEGTSVDAISDGIKYVIIGISIFTVLYFIIYFIFCRSKYEYAINIHYKDKLKSISLLPAGIITKLLVGFTMLALVLYISAINLNFIDYVKFQSSSSKIYQNYYVNPQKVKINFPKNKKNLIYIYVESLEMTNASKLNGGLLNTSYIPNMEKIALDNTNFSNTPKLGGAKQVVGTEWTIAGMVAQTSGIPLKIPISGNNSGNRYSVNNSFLPGAYSLGEVLEDNGYTNYFLLGSKAEFAGRKTYFQKHGNYRIYDYKYAVKQKDIDKDYYVWWGYEDKKLYKFAKEKITEISSRNEPFNFTMLTADTHFPDGYLDKSCPEKFDSNYANSIYCTDKMLFDFLEWLKEQDFYENTVVIISGDHLTMQKKLFTEGIDDQRTVFNTIINSNTKISKEKNREFSTLDMYPTTLAALGCKIDGNRLGLGTNLYSDKKTLIEQLGYDNFNIELAKNSTYYNKKILKDKDYYDLKNIDDKK